MPALRSLERAKKGVPTAPCSSAALSARFQGRKRKFSCTMARTPAASAARAIASASASVGASGFWHMKASPAAAAASASARCRSAGEQMSITSGRSAEIAASSVG